MFARNINSFIVGALVALFVLAWSWWRQRRAAKRRAGPLRITALYCYPLKSAAGLKLPSLDFDRLGFLNDRRYMAVTPESGNFITQRQEPKMALIVPSFEGDDFVLNAPGMPSLRVPATLSSGPISEVKVWGDKIQARDYGSEPAAWLTKYLGQPAKLVTIISEAKHARRLPQDWDASDAKNNINASFSDGFPFLLASEDSLAELNSRIRKSDRPYIRNFRPNIVVAGAARPWDEDTWTKIAFTPKPVKAAAVAAADESAAPASRLEFIVAKPCTRCSMPTVDQWTGKRNARNEPTATLTKYRQHGDKVYFGQNLIQCQPTGRLNIGDRVEILSRQTEEELWARVLAIEKKNKEKKAKEDAEKAAKEGKESKVTATDADSKEGGAAAADATDGDADAGSKPKPRRVTRSASRRDKDA